MVNKIIPKINGKEGKSIGLSGAPTMDSVPLTLSNSSNGPRECFAATVSSIKSRVLFFSCNHTPQIN